MVDWWMGRQTAVPISDLDAGGWVAAFPKISSICSYCMGDEHRPGVELSDSRFWYPFSSSFLPSTCTI